MSIIDKIKLNGTTYDVGKILDTTLTHPGQAADAKVVGDKITGLKEDLDNTNSKLSNSTEASFSGSNIVCGWEQGGYNFGTGIPLESVSTNRIRTKDYIDSSIKYIVADSTQAEFGILAYDDSGTYLGCWNGTQLTTRTAWNTEADLDRIGKYNYKLSIRDINEPNKDIGVEYADYLTCSTVIDSILSLIAKSFCGESLVNSTTTLSDFNDAVVNRYYSINTTDIPNQPVAKKGHLLCFGLNGGSSDTLSGRKAQIFISATSATNGRIYYRYVTFAYPVTWSAWKKIANTSELDNLNDEISTALEQKFSGEELVNSTTELSDFNDAITNRYYSINTTDIPNQPVAKKGHLLCFGLNGGSSATLSGRKTQIFISATNGRIYYRYVTFAYPVTWSAWIKLINTKDDVWPSISMFKSIGVIGDSYASGEIYDADANTHQDYYDLSWIQVLARTNGITGVNYSVGGLSTQDWLSSSYGLEKLNSEDPNNLYIIALGINDNRKLGIDKLGTISDITSDSTDSFYSYYGRIVRAIQSHAPNAFIMLSTLARFNKDYSSQHYDDFSNAVRSIANYYHFPLLDLAKSDFFMSDWFFDNQISGHPVAVSYSAMAKEYTRLIEQAMRDNSTYFNKYTG